MGVLLAACLVLPSIALAAHPAPEWFRVFSEPMTARALLGRPVQSAQGEHRGTVMELQFDLAHNRIRRVVINRQDRRIAVPVHALDIRRNRRHVVLDIPGEPVVQSWDRTRLVSSGELLGARVAAGAGAVRGQVLDVVIDAFWGDASFAVVDTGEGLRPVPLDAFFRRADGFELAVPASKLQEIPPFTHAELQARLARLDTQFLQRNARLAHRLTPLP